MKPDSGGLCLSKHHELSFFSHKITLRIIFVSCQCLQIKTFRGDFISLWMIERYPF